MWPLRRKKANIQQIILALNDHPRTLEELKQMVSRSKCPNVDIDSGREAKKKLKRNKYDILIQDLQRPAPNGFELYHWMKHQKALRNIPIILATVSTPRNISNDNFTIIDGMKFEGTFRIEFEYSEGEFGKRPKNVGDSPVMYVEGYFCLGPYIEYLKKTPKYIPEIINDIFSYRSSIRDIDSEYERRNKYLWPNVL